MAGCLHVGFEQQARRTPDKTAIDCDGASLTYGALDARADLLAARLRDAGVGPDALVALCLERSLDSVVAILAVLKAGGAYVPLDPDYPPARLALMLEDAAPKVIVSHSGLHRRLPAHDAEAILVDTIDWSAPRPAAAPGPGIGPDNLAYCIFTSGSTGRPKGVLITHRNVVRLFQSTEGWFDFGLDDVWTVAHSFSFDFSVWELWGALLYGGTAVIVPAATARAPERLRELLGRRGVTVLNTTPSAFYAVLDADAAAHDAPPLRLRLVVFGGEALEFRRLAEWFARHGDSTRLINMYGITETTVHVTYQPVDRNALGAASVIGVPIPDLQVHLLDEARQPVGPGETGEMYIGGAGVARGYLNRPELTAERFIADPFAAEGGAQLYKSGDLARRRPDGTLEFRGRADYQVKLRGYRIELGEIEAALNALPEIRQSVVVLREAPGGNKQLVAYVLVEKTTRISAAALRQSLARSLPDYMLPAAFVELDAWPLTANNKIDRDALPEPRREDSVVDQAFVAPQTATETHVAALWGEAFGLERIGVHDGFFALGGHSLLAARMCARLRETFGIPLSITDILASGDVAGLSRRIDALRTDGSAAAVPPLGPEPRSGPIPAGLSQRQVLYLYGLAPDSLAYNNQVLIRLRGRLDFRALERALNEIVRRHELLRTSFTIVDGEWRQIIHPPWPVRLAPITDTPGKIAELLRHHFDPERLPLVQWSLIRVAPDEHVFVHLEHHLIHDGWSFGVFLRELGSLYTAFHGGQDSPLPELAVQFADFTQWQRRMLQGETRERLLRYWKAKLAGPLPVLELLTDRARPKLQTFRGTEVMFELPPTLAAALRSLARRRRSSLFAVMLAAFYALLYRYTGQDDIIVGSGFANRRTKDIETLIGMVLNMLPLRADLRGDPAFLELVERVQKLVEETLDHQDLPFELLVENVPFARDPSRNPLFQVAFNFHDAQVPTVHWPELTGDISYPHNGFAKFDINVIVIPWAEQQIGAEPAARDDRITVKWDYNSDLFDAATIDLMIGHYRRLLQAVVADPGQGISELALADDTERRKLLLSWNETARDYPRDRCIHDLFAREAVRAPDATAVVFGDATLSYRDLDERSDRLAQYLRAAGVSTEVKVGLCVERSFDMVVAILAILKAGGVYVPLDPEYPESRLSFMVGDAKTSIVVTQSHLRNRLPASAARIVCLDLEADAIANCAPVAPDPCVGPTNLAYVMYTSGSTGTPKGVCVAHRSVVRLVKQADHVALGPDEVFLHISPLAFDASTFELWGALLNGAKVVVFHPGVPTLEELARTIRTSRVTTLWLTAALFHRMVDAELDTLVGVRQILAGGEALSVPHVRRMLAAMPPGHRLINGYGPTENTTFTACHVMTRSSRIGRSVPIGRPIANTRIYILDEKMQPTPVGIPGELCAGGDGLAWGYLNQPALTAERFVKDPFSAEPGARLYRTGDLARFLPDGTIEFIGRSDTQVKLNGFRIELGEIEAVLAEHPNVRRAAAVIRDDEDAPRRLVAYVEGRADAQPTAEDLRQFLRMRMPGYMVPTAFYPVEAIPMTANGKIDRAALLAGRGDADQPPTSPTAPRNPTERALFEIWAHHFGHDRFGVEDEFFDIGGHSLLAAGIFADITARFGITLPLAVLFDAPTIAAIARRIDTAQQRTAEYIVPVQSEGSRTPIFAVAGAGGSAIAFAALAKVLGRDQPLFGLEAPGLTDERKPFERIEDVAAFLVEEMRPLDLRKPRVLLGACSGAHVVFEIACRLADEGRPVDWVIMVDPSPTGESRRPSKAGIPIWRKLVLPRFFLARLALYVRYFRALSGAERGRFLREKLGLVGEILRTRDLFRGSRAEIAQTRTLEAAVAALRSYTPRPYAGRVGLILGERFDEAGGTLSWSHWATLCSGPFKVERMGGTSTGMMFRPPLVDVLAQCIESIRRSAG